MSSDQRRLELIRWHRWHREYTAELFRRTWLTPDDAVDLDELEDYYKQDLSPAAVVQRIIKENDLEERK